MAEGFANEWEEMREEEFEVYGDTTQAEAYDDEAPQVEVPVVKSEPEPEVPAAVRLAALVQKMPGQTKTLSRILAKCAEPVITADLIAAILDWQRFNYSIYSPATLCTLLEGAGGLERVNEDGSPYVDEPVAAEEPEQAEAEEAAEAQPEEAPIAVEDEEEFDDSVAEPVAPQPVFWRTTQAGMELVEELDPRKKIAAMLDDEDYYLPVYRELLESLADGPMTKAQVDAIVKASPLTQEPMRLGGYFIDRLERIEAIEWVDAWQITDIGTELLANEALY